MTYMPTGPGQGGPQRPGGQRPEDQYPDTRHPGNESSSEHAGDTKDGLGRTLGLVAAGLGLLILLLGYTSFRTVSFVSGPYTQSSGQNFFQAGHAAPLALLFIAGLIAAIGILPEQTKHAGVAAAVAVGGFLYLVLIAIAVGASGGISLAWGAYLELVLGLILTAAVVGAMLIDAGVISPSAKKAGQESPFGGGAGQYGQQGGAQYGQQGGSPYGQSPASQYGPGPGQFGAPQDPSEHSGGYGQGNPAPAPPAQQGSGYYGQQPQQPPYGQQAQPQQQSYGQAPQPQDHQQEQPAWQQQDNPEQGQPSSYGPPTQAFGSHAVADETTVHPRENPYGPPHQQ